MHGQLCSLLREVRLRSSDGGLAQQLRRAGHPLWTPRYALGQTIRAWARSPGLTGYVPPWLGGVAGGEVQN